jgi:hypothetical protein
MKNASVAHIAGRSDAQVFWRVPRGWIVILAALLAWLVVIGLIAAGARLFGMLVALF